MLKKSLATIGLVLGASVLPADTYNVAEGTQTLSSVTNTSRFTKSGAGELVLTGDNSLKGVTMSGGTLTISGGSTTISDSGSTGAYGNDALYNQTAGTVVIKDGAIVTASAGNYFNPNNGTFLVTNATFDATGIKSHVMNAFHNSGGCRFVIAKDGVVKVGAFRPTGMGDPSLKEKISVDLNEGGSLYIKQFWVDNAARYGRINFNGGTLYPTATDTTPGKPDGWLFICNSDGTRPPWTQHQTEATVREGGFHIYSTANNYVYAPFMSGAEADGGAHFKGTNGALYWRAKGSTYNGGTWLEGNGAILALQGTDNTTFGAIPAERTTNIWVTGANHTLFSDPGDTVIHSNRTLLVSTDNTFRIGSQGRFIFNNEIKGAIKEGATLPSSVTTYIKGNAGWDGRVVFDPGVDCTNDVGKLRVEGFLEITSGVTRAVASSQATGTGAALYVHGVSPVKTAKGHLVVSGGQLDIPSGYYVDTRDNAQVDIVGGKIKAECEWLHALSGSATLSVSNGGEFAVHTFRVGQQSASPAPVINLGKGGTINAMFLKIETKLAQNTVFNFDGGTLRSRRNNSDFVLTSSSERWDGVKFTVRAGGAVFAMNPNVNFW